ncbi:MAG: hypothetical protein NTY77_11530 [Elusimicrobia bacterium]|nr:hypothetical protein [Elusimicrobiota bacterium]
MVLQGSLRRLVIATRGWPLFGAGYCAAYGLAVRLAALLLAPLAALYLRRGLSRQGLTPGVSDVDLLAVLDIPRDGEADLLRGLWRRYRLAKSLFPMLGELQVATKDELAAYLSCGGIRRLEAPGWQVLRGGAPPAPAPAGVDSARLHLHEALAAYIFLSQTYFESAREPRLPDFGFRVAKGFLDVLRHASAAQDGLPTALERLRARSELTGSLPGDLRRGLEQPDLLDRDAGLRLLGLALSRIDGLCGGLALPAASAPTGPAHSPPANAGCDGWPALLSALGPGTGLFMDTLFHWYVVLSGAPEPEALRKVAGLMDGWHLRDPRFQSAGWLVTRNVMQALLLVPHLDTPFFAWALGGPDRGDGLWVRALSRHPLWAGHYRLRWKLGGGLRPPGPEELRRSARQAASELALALRMFGLGSWAGGNSYRLFFLYSRVLSLRLFLERGVIVDPHDIDALLDAYAEHFPEARSWLERLAAEELRSPAAELDALDPAELFYRHLPFLRAQADAALARLWPD